MIQLLKFSVFWRLLSSGMWHYSLAEVY